MSVELDIVLEDDRWQALEPLAQAACDAVATHLDLPQGCEVVLLAANDARILDLNGAYRAKYQATNVLSWPSEELGAQDDGGQPDAPTSDFPDEPPALGDIALAYETCKNEAELANRAFCAHLTHLIVHGMLHLLGYDHVRERDAELMEGLEVAILAKLGLPDPYL